MYSKLRCEQRVQRRYPARSMSCQKMTNLVTDEINSLNCERRVGSIHEPVAVAFFSTGTGAIEMGWVKAKLGGDFTGVTLRQTPLGAETFTWEQGANEPPVRIRLENCPLTGGVEPLDLFDPTASTGLAHVETVGCYSASDNARIADAHAIILGTVEV
jgi:hypothetical protein